MNGGDFRDTRDDAELAGFGKCRKRQRSKSPEKRREDIAGKRLRGEALTLDEKRAEEAEAVKVILKNINPTCSTSRNGCLIISRTNLANRSSRS